MTVNGYPASPPTTGQSHSFDSPALAALTADLPAAILADLLGLHVNTAVRSVTYARREWTDYLAARAAEHGKPQRDE
ncbi:hypothetical protein [Streptomyces sp. NPDC050704]|uniref:hypothetical protein n=1 Tax=Streptomyces sp. NPDC050704 TaxID=3157219 RepID=UPI003424EBED